MSFLLPALLLILIATPILFITRTDSRTTENPPEVRREETLIVVITVTYRTVTRIPDLFTLANSLANVKDLFWVVVDNSTEKPSIDAIADIVKQSNLPSVLLNAKCEANTSYTTRVDLYNYGLFYVRTHMGELGEMYKNIVVYFADVDYSYDLRLWNHYVRKVEKIGIWNVGRPIKTSDKEQKKLNATEMRSPYKYFDLANMAFNAELILDPPVEFEEKCKFNYSELCFIKDLDMPKDHIQYFQNENPDDLLIWQSHHGYERFLYKLDLYNYLVETDPEVEEKPKNKTV